MPRVLRPYQVDALAAVRGELESKSSTLLVVATGTGKRPQGTETRTATSSTRRCATTHEYHQRRRRRPLDAGTVGVVRGETCGGSATASGCSTPPRLRYPGRQVK
jgi:hypothetical protein